MRLNEEAPADGTPSPGGPSTPAVPPADPTGFSSVMPAELFEDDEPQSGDDFDAGEGTPAVVAPPPAEPAPPAPTPPAEPAPVAAPAEPAPVEPPPAAPATPPAEPVAAVPVAPAPAPAAPQIPAVETEADRVARRDRYRSDLEQRYSALLTEDDRQALVTDPAVVLPKMAAEMHMRTVEATLEGLSRLLPQAIRDTMSQIGTATRNEEQFFSIHKELNTPEGRQVVSRILNTHLALNPLSTMDQVVKEVGAAAKLAMGIQSQAPVAPPSTPVPPPAPRPTTTSGAPVVPPKAPKQMGEQEAFFEEIITEGRGL